MRQLFKGDNYLREETIRGNTVCGIEKNLFDYKQLSLNPFLRGISISMPLLFYLTKKKFELLFSR